MSKKNIEYYYIFYTYIAMSILCVLIIFENYNIFQLITTISGYITLIFITWIIFKRFEKNQEE